MLRTLFSGVSGLHSHQVKMDVIGNNIANVNTTAFKAGRVTFKEGFAQLLQGGTRSTDSIGGINPSQVGLGSQIGSLDTSFAQGNLETTGLNTDLAIQGEALFVTRMGAKQLYTRSGNFQVDGSGRLVAPPNGCIVQGRLAKNGVFQDGITDIVLPFGQKTPAKATGKMNLAGNLDASAPVFDTSSYADSAVGFNTETRANPANSKSWAESSLTTYDSLGNKWDVRVNMWKTGDAEWTWEVDPTALVAAGVPADSITGGGVIKFAGDGTLVSPTVQNIAFNPPGANPISIKMDPGSGVNGLTQFSSATTAVLRDQDGYTSGQLQNFSIDRSGTIQGTFSNGVNIALAQICVADFNNPEGLLRSGDNMYQESGNSGGPVIGFPTQGSSSTLTAGALEMSNVDLASEFTAMIVAQRGFQANSKVITTSDEMLQEMMQLKR